MFTLIADPSNRVPSSNVPEYSISSRSPFFAPLLQDSQTLSLSLLTTSNTCSPDWEVPDKTTNGVSVRGEGHRGLVDTKAAHSFRHVVLAVLRLNASERLHRKRPSSASSEWLAPVLLRHARPGAHT